MSTARAVVEVGAYALAALLAAKTRPPFWHEWRGLPGAQLAALLGNSEAVAQLVPFTDVLAFKEGGLLHPSWECVERPPPQVGLGPLRSNQLCTIGLKCKLGNLAGKGIQIWGSLELLARFASGSRPGSSAAGSSGPPFLLGRPS